MLRIVIPNGTLEQGTLRFLKEAGVIIPQRGRKMKVEVNHLLIKEVWFSRPQHIPQLVKPPYCDVGICGKDWVEEYNVRFRRPFHKELMSLPYGKRGSQGKTEVVLFCSKKTTNQDPRSVDIYRDLISEYPLLTKRFFWERYRMEVYPDISWGTTESLVPEPYPWGICLTETRKTLHENGLKEVATILKSYTMLFTHRIGNEPSKEQAIVELIDLFKQLLMDVRKEG